MKITTLMGLSALFLVACSTEPATKSNEGGTPSAEATGTSEVALTLDRVP